MFLWMSSGWMAMKRCFQSVQPRYWRKLTCLPRPAVSEKNLQITECSFGALYLVLYVEGGSEKNLWNNKNRNSNWTVRMKKTEEVKDVVASLRTIKKKTIKNIVKELKHSLYLTRGISFGDTTMVNMGFLYTILNHGITLNSLLQSCQ